MCETFAISRQAYYAARKQPAPSDGPRVPAARGDRWVPAEELRAAIHEVVGHHLAWGVRKVWAVLQRRGLCAGHKRIWALMKADGLTMPPSRLRESPGRYGHVAVADSNRRWGSGLTTTWTRQDGTAALVPIMDYGDRVAFRCKVTKSQESAPVLEPTEKALRAAFGDPANLPEGFAYRTDHGPQFTGRDCESLCEHWGIDHSFAPVGHPAGNAVVERFIETLEIELIWTRDWESVEELQEAIDDWLHVYNSERPHQVLGWMTPAEKRAQNLGLRLEGAA
jgi:putative transposase